MVCLSRWILVCALLLGGVPLCSAASAENNAFNQAAKKFQAGFWELAAADFSAFTTNYPTSFRVPEAILFEAEALIKARSFDAGRELLSTNLHRAGEWADLYLYWMAQAEVGNSNYAGAAETFARLVQEFPDSTNRLEACVAQAAAYSKIGQWQRISELLGDAKGVFQQTASATTNDLVARGFLLLGEAELARKNFMQAEAASAVLGAFPLKPEFAWHRWHLQSRIEASQQKLNEALISSTNLVDLARAANNDRLRAESYVLIASILEQATRFADAINVHEAILSATNSPVEQQRTALLKIAELSLRMNTSDATSNAVYQLERFRNEHPRSAATDTVLLTLGELQLKQAVTGRTVQTNLLDQASARFDVVLTNYPQSTLVGKAHLGKGWCLWYSGQISASEAAFRQAAERLPKSGTEALASAVAQFKAADAQCLSGNYSGAVETYNNLINSYASVPEVKDRLLEQALYQTVRAALAATNLAAATEAMGKILEWYPNGMMGDQSLLLVAEGYAQKNEPARARELLHDFEKRFGAETNSLLPEVRLAISRSYEKEGNWNAAITNYESWISDFPKHVRMPEARFALAWGAAMAGQETNALTMFNSFAADYPADLLAARAKWWIGDYYFRQGNFPKAEENYPYTTNYAGSDLFFLAHLRAGRAAMARLSYKDAISYFTSLISNPLCPGELKVKAALAAGDAFMARNEPGATNRLADLEEASGYFNYVLKTFPTNAQVPSAWGLLGNCYKEMGTLNPKYYDRAVEAYGKVISLPAAGVAAHRQAKIGLGIIAEARAEGKTGEEQNALLKEALAHYADAFTFQDLQASDAGDVFWYQKAGLETARVAGERLGEWGQAVNVYRQLQSAPNLSSAFQATLGRRMEQARKNVKPDQDRKD